MIVKTPNIKKKQITCKSIHSTNIYECLLLSKHCLRGPAGFKIEKTEDVGALLPPQFCLYPLILPSKQVANTKNQQGTQDAPKLPPKPQPRGSFQDRGPAGLGSSGQPWCPACKEAEAAWSRAPGQGARLNRGGGGTGSGGQNSHGMLHPGSRGQRLAIFQKVHTTLCVHTFFWGESKTFLRFSKEFNEKGRVSTAPNERTRQTVAASRAPALGTPARYLLLVPRRLRRGWRAGGPGVPRPPGTAHR